MPEVVERIESTVWSDQLMSMEITEVRGAHLIDALLVRFDVVDADAEAIAS